MVRKVDELGHKYDVDWMMRCLIRDTRSNALVLV